MSIRSNKFDLGLQSSDSTLGYTGKFVVGEGTLIDHSTQMNVYGINFRSSLTSFKFQEVGYLAKGSSVSLLAILHVTSLLATRVWRCLDDRAVLCQNSRSRQRERGG
jgi:hypothetical protein